MQINRPYGKMMKDEKIIHVAGGELQREMHKYLEFARAADPAALFN